jgi:hypothetical protein
MGSKLESFTTARDEEEDSKEFSQTERRDRRSREKMIGGNIEGGKLWK